MSIVHTPRIKPGMNKVAFVPTSIKNNDKNKVYSTNLEAFGAKQRTKLGKNNDFLQFYARQIIT